MKLPSGLPLVSLLNSGEIQVLGYLNEMTSVYQSF